MQIDKLQQGGWGVCGFVAAMQAAEANQKGSKYITTSNSDYEAIMKLVRELTTGAFKKWYKNRHDSKIASQTNARIAETDFELV